ncbi:MAG: hypothetical protein ACI9S8_000303 [Chlamydiales bacterium]|jgi:hypothetical protein
MGISEVILESATNFEFAGEPSAGGYSLSRKNQRTKARK